MNLFLSLGKRKEALVMIIYHHLSFFMVGMRTQGEIIAPSGLNRICPTGLTGPIGLTSPHRSHIMVFGVRVMPFGCFSGLFSQIKG